MKRAMLGMTTLLLTSVILLVALLLVLGVYRGVFYQVQLVHNEIQEQNAHWKAEGAAECAFAKIRLLPTFPDEFDECDRDVEELSFSGTLVQSIKAVSGYSMVTRALAMPMATTIGVVKSSSDLILSEQSTFEPDVGELVADDRWQCVVLSYKHLFFARSVTTLDPELNGDPSSVQHCAERYKTLAATAANAKSDYQHDPALEPFRDLFNIERQQWFSLMASPAFGRIPRTLDDVHSGQLKYSRASQLPYVEFNLNCSHEIIDLLRRGKDLIWVYGGCELNEQDVTKINIEIESQFGSSHGIILLVQDGILAIESNERFKGLVYQFVSPERSTMQFSTWSQAHLVSSLNHYIASFSVPMAININQVSYYQYGRFNPVGGLVLDAPNTFAVIQGELHFHYNKTLIATPLGKIRQRIWQQGSWHAQ
jgi:hypothetical protein